MGLESPVKILVRTSEKVPSVPSVKTRSPLGCTSPRNSTPYRLATPQSSRVLWKSVKCVRPQEPRACQAKFPEARCSTVAARRPLSERVKAPRPDASIMKGWKAWPRSSQSEEHTSELQSHSDLVCRLLLEKKNTSKHPSAR